MPRVFKSDGHEIAQSYVAESRPAEGGRYLAHFGAPGLEIDVSRDRSGEPRLFDTAAAAEIEALYALRGVLNAPRESLGSSKTHVIGKPGRISAADFAVALRMLGISPGQFSVIYGTTLNRVMDWIDGKDNVPHPARILLTLFHRDRQNIQAAMDAAQQAVTERRAKEG